MVVEAYKILSKEELKYSSDTLNGFDTLRLYLNSIW